MAANQLLAALTAEDRDEIVPHMIALDLQPGAVLVHSGEDVIETWFPCGAAMAAFCVGNLQGDTIDVALVGREGAIGGIVSNGHVPAYTTAVVRFPGRFMRIKSSALEQAKLASITLRHWFARYSDCLLAQVFQTAACNATHTIRQRTAKWLLARLERTGSKEFPLTQEQLADMLGVGRSFVNRVVGSLRAEGVVATRRGVFVINDEAALRALSCDCNIAVENHFDTVLHGIYPRA